MVDYDFKPSEETCTRQQQAILERLRRGEVSTIEIREGLGIGHPAGRIMELRHQGWTILTHPGQARDAAGRWHRSAIYRLGLRLGQGGAV